MDYHLIDSTILKHEGERLDVYPDSLGNPTVGIGHLVRPEDNLKVGDKITKEQSTSLYIKDRNQVINDAKSIFPDFESFPDSAQAAILSMIFNLGKTRFSTFTNTISMIKNHDWQRLSDYLNSSAFNKWRSQVGQRVADIAGLFKSASGASIVIGIIGLGAVAFIIYKYLQHRGAA